MADAGRLEKLGLKTGQNNQLGFSLVDRRSGGQPRPSGKPAVDRGERQDWSTWDGRNVGRGSWPLRYPHLRKPLLRKGL